MSLHIPSPSPSPYSISSIIEMFKMSYLFTGWSNSNQHTTLSILLQMTINFLNEVKSNSESKLPSKQDLYIWTKKFFNRTVEEPSMFSTFQHMWDIGTKIYLLHCQCTDSTASCQGYFYKNKFLQLSNPLIKFTLVNCRPHYQVSYQWLAMVATLEAE